MYRRDSGGNASTRQLETGCDDQPINRAGSLGDSNHLALMEAESSRSEEPRSDQEGDLVNLITGCFEVLAYILILVGGGVTVLVCLTGFASLGHTYPVPIGGLSAVLVGSLLLWFLKNVKRR